MPRTKDNYHKTKIFGIYNDDNKLIYIGHTTTTLKTHFKVIIRHRIMKLDVRAQIASYAYQDSMAIGWSIKLLEEYPCAEFWQAQAKTQMYINRLRPIVNIIMKETQKFYKRTKIKRLTIQCPYCISLDEEPDRLSE